PCRRRDHALQFVHRAINIIGAMHEELRFFTLLQIRKIRIVHRRAKADQFGDSRILATGSKTHPAPKAESRDEKRNVWKFGGEKIKSGADVISLTRAAIVLSLAHSRAAKIEAQHRKPQRTQRLCSLIDHFVVHRAAE